MEMNINLLQVTQDYISVVHYIYLGVMGKEDKIRKRQIGEK